MKLTDFVEVITGSEILHIHQYGSSKILFTGYCKELKTSENWGYLSELEVQFIIARSFGEQCIYVD